MPLLDDVVISAATASSASVLAAPPVIEAASVCLEASAPCYTGPELQQQSPLNGRLHVFQAGELQKIADKDKGHGDGYIASSPELGKFLVKEYNPLSIAVINELIANATIQEMSSHKSPVYTRPIAGVQKVPLGSTGLAVEVVQVAINWIDGCRPLSSTILSRIGKSPTMMAIAAKVMFGDGDCFNCFNLYTGI
jgi:hypothetical protein